ncbi:hypothetical protein ABGB07_33210 [Micromonosporaceae bacterium B7E4]
MIAAYSTCSASAVSSPSKGSSRGPVSGVAATAYNTPARVQQPAQPALTRRARRRPVRSRLAQTISTATAIPTAKYAQQRGSHMCR